MAQTPEQIALGQALLAQQPPQMVAETPEEFLARMQRLAPQGPMTPWNRALLQIGTQLMQPVPVGQTSAGHVGQALSGGLGAYDAAERQRLAQGLTIGEAMRKDRELRGAEAKRAEEIVTSEAARRVQASKAPSDLGVADSQNALREAQAREADARAKALTSQANVADRALQVPKRQALKTEVVETQDGGKIKVTDWLVDGQRYTEQVTLPMYTDVNAARAVAIKETDEKTPGIFRGVLGAVPEYAPLTREQEIARRTRELLTGKTLITGPGGQTLTPEQFASLGQGDTPMPAAFPYESPADYDKARRQQIEQIKKSIAEARAEGRSEDAAALQKELEAVVARTAKEAEQRKKSNRQVTAERDANGNIVVKRPNPAAAPSAATPAPAAAAPAPVQAPIGTQAAELALANAQAAFQQADREMRMFTPQQMGANPDLWRNAMEKSRQAKMAVLQAEEALRQARRSEVRWSETPYTP